MSFEKVVLTTGTNGWFKGGKFHRLDGPAYHPISRARVWRKDDERWPEQEREWWERE